MSFFIAIAGPWIVLMALDLFWTRQGLETAASEPKKDVLGRVQYLLQAREPSPSRGRPRRVPKVDPGEGTLDREPS
jgi:hypothetical protein